jgi:Fe2+ transport system protein FeoA
VKLSEAVSGRTYEVAAVDPGAPRSLQDLGIYPGQQLRVVAAFPLAGPLLVEAGDTRVAVARQAARYVSVTAVGARPARRESRALSLGRCTIYF